MVSKKMGSKEELNKVMYSYTTNINELDEENRILKQTVGKLKEEIDFNPSLKEKINNFVGIINRYIENNEITAEVIKKGATNLLDEINDILKSDDKTMVKKSGLLKKDTFGGALV